jgi:hypothetical protein
VLPNDGGSQSENLFHNCPNTFARASGEPEADWRIGRTAAPDAGGGRMKLLYMGFAHKTTGIRHYSFQGQIPDGTRKGFFVSTDVALLTKHHIQIQEVPMMCLRLLESAAEAQPQLALFILTEADMLAHISAKAAVKEQATSKRMKRSLDSESPEDLNVSPRSSQPA